MADKLQQSGKYEIISELGCGAFATVHKALDTILDREEILKVLLSKCRYCW
jgi:serine/threonine protein kinase